MFRSLGKSKITWVLVILFGISLFFFRGSKRYSNFFNSDNVIAKVSGTPISTSKFNRTLDINIQQFNQILGKPISQEEIRKFQIHKLALNGLINDAIFENEFDKQNFKLDETVIAKRTKITLPELYNENNKLDENYLKEFLKQQNLKIEDIVQIIHYNARSDFFNDALLNIKYPSMFSSKIESYEKHERIINYIKFPIESVDITSFINNNENTLDDILNSYYQNNINLYMSDEKRDLDYILIDKENIINSFIPSFDEINEYYNNNLSLFIEKEKRSFIQFNFKTLDEAKKIKNKIEKISLYDELLSFADNNNVQYNFFQNLSKDDIMDEIAESLFNLKLNNQSAIIESPIANHIVVLKNIEPRRQLTFDEVKENISLTIAEIDSNNYLLDLESNISQDILNGMDLIKLANKYSLNLLNINNITRNYNNFANKDKLFYESLIENAFNANVDYVNDIIRLDKNKFYIYNVTNILFSNPLNFDEIRNKVFENWKFSKRIEEIQIATNLNKNNKNFINKLASKYNTKINQISIMNTNGNLPKILISDIFSNELDTINFANTDNEIFVAKVLDIKIPKNNNDNYNNIQLIDDFKNILKLEMLKNVKISINDNLINVLIDSY